MQEVKTHGVGYIRIATDLMAAKTDIVWFALGIFLAARVAWRLVVQEKTLLRNW
jgi:hypothetical protein